jgi:hypothetical protein
VTGADLENAALAGLHRFRAPPPIAADYVVRAVEIPLNERSDVVDDDGLRAGLQSTSSPTRPPSAPRGA